MHNIWQRYTSPPSWVWFIAFTISLGLLFLLGLKQEYLFEYWAYVAGYNTILILLGAFYLLKFYRFIQRQKHDHTIGAKFTFNLLRVVPILTLLPIASFYAFSFSTVQENTKLAEEGFGNLNTRLLEEIETINQNLSLFRAEEYFNISANILNVVRTSAGKENFEITMSNFLNALVQNGQICRAIIIQNESQLVSNSRKSCNTIDIAQDLDSEFNIVDKNDEVLYTKLTLINTDNNEDMLTLLTYFIKDKNLNGVFERIKNFKFAVDNAKINISNTILTKQFIVDFVTTIALTIIAMMILIAKMLGNLMIPLNNITIASRKISHGEYGVLAPKTTHDDDMNIVLTEFNKMSLQVKEARTGLDTKNIYLETIIKYSDAIIAFDTKFRTSLINERAMELLGIQSSEIIGKSHTALELDFLSDIISSFNHQEKFSIDLAHNRLILDITGATLTDNARKLGFILIIKDITQITKNQKLLAWKEVARRMAHEVKNPLNPILLSAERLRNKILDSEVEESHKHIIDKTTKTIITQVQSINTIISSFSDLGKTSAHREHTSLNEIIIGVRELYTTVDITIKLEELPLLSLDKEAINRVFINLVKNSIEAQRDDKLLHIVIHTHKKDGNVVITITDNGLGFDAHTLDTAFEPYVTTKSSGTGLGMAIVAKVIQEHGGSITIDSAYTQGARLIILLPSDSS